MVCMGSFYRKKRDGWVLSLDSLHLPPFGSKVLSQLKGQDIKIRNGDTGEKVNPTFVPVGLENPS